MSLKHIAGDWVRGIVTGNTASKRAIVLYDSRGNDVSTKLTSAKRLVISEVFLQTTDAQTMALYGHASTESDLTLLVGGAFAAAGGLSKIYPEGLFVPLGVVPQLKNSAASQFYCFLTGLMTNI